MECIECKPKGFCLSRQGEVLTQEIIDNPDLVHDRHFCRHKKGRECYASGHAPQRGHTSSPTAIQRNTSDQQQQVREDELDSPYKLRPRGAVSTTVDDT